MAELLHLELVTPEKRVFADDVLACPATDRVPLEWRRKKTLFGALRCSRCFGVNRKLVLMGWRGDWPVHVCRIRNLWTQSAGTQIGACRPPRPPCGGLPALSAQRRPVA